ncbi:MAG: hypothetical protein ACFCVD_11555 [Nodosilinea sp.]
MINALFEQFVEARPPSVMMRGLMARILVRVVFPCELNTLGYPSAALLVFCIAVVAF